MKFEAADKFYRDFNALPVEHRRQFLALMPAFNKACDAYIAEPGISWPAALRVKPMVSAKGVWEMTWSFARPDGRAVFEFFEDKGETLVRWRRIGDHSVFDNP